MDTAEDTFTNRPGIFRLSSILGRTRDAHRTAEGSRSVLERAEARDRSLFHDRGRGRTNMQVASNIVLAERVLDGRASQTQAIDRSHRIGQTEPRHRGAHLDAQTIRTDSQS